MGPRPTESCPFSGKASTTSSSNKWEAAFNSRNLGQSDNKTHLPSLERQLSDGYAWDRFREADIDPWQSFSYYVSASHKWVLKSLVSLFFLMCLIASLICNKASLLLATSSMIPGKNSYKCHKTEHGKICMAVPRHWQSATNLYCLPPPADEDKTHDVSRMGAQESATWALSAVLMMLLPYVISTIVHLGLCCTQSSGFPRFRNVLYFLSVDTLSLTGSFVFLFYTLPAVEDSSVAFLLLSTVYLFPMVSSLLVHGSTTFTLVSIITHVSCVVIWVYHFTSIAHTILVPASLAALGLVSLNSYLESKKTRRASSLHKLPLYIMENNYKRGEGNSKLVLIRNMWSIVLIILTAVLLVDKKYNLNLDHPLGSINEIMTSIVSSGAIYVLLANVLSGIVMVVSLKVLRRMSVGSWMIAVTVLISMLVGFAVLYVVSNAWNADPCVFSSVMRPRVFLNAWVGPWNAYWWQGYVWLFVPWWITLWWFHRDVITSEGHQHDTSNYELPWSTFPDIPLMTSKTNIAPYDQNSDDFEDFEDNDIMPDQCEYKKSTSHPCIYACVTMWHETEAEMMNILQSLYRMDLDQHHREEKHHKRVNSNGLYEFEAHVFFDDAFEGRSRTANQFVHNLITVAQDAASEVYGGGIRLRLPIRMATPYGARLVWYLPGGNRLVAHLKDKELIRHGKRWSQVMYMYYLLTQKLKKGGDADNTFILTLDGDVQFQPEAVHRLVHQIRRSPDVGSVCGRVHPVGNGPWVWYQRFEYAAAHWIQKTTEHVLGSVLCSPGCFSIVRASRLMADGVVKAFTKMPTEARHFLQYDQGEDRWLCTLLMQQGFTVEYSSESHVTTCAPESFYEFFNQRRRWTPASIVNNFDLLINWSQHATSSINTIYMYYLMIQLIASLFGTSAIFLLCVRALELASGDYITFDQSAIVNIILMCIVITACYTCNQKWQIRVCAMLSIHYAVVQALVLLGLVGHVWYGKFCTPETIFLLVMTGLVVLSAVVHPAEARDVAHFLVYFIAIPATYVVLMIYTVANMHSVKWGTREAKAPSEASGDNGAYSRQRRASISRRHSLTMPVIPEESFTLLSEAYQRTTNILPSDGSAVITDDIVKQIPGATDISLRACIDESSLGCGPVAALDQSESLFFNELIERYLFPIEGDRNHQKKCEQQLKGLRNRFSLFFFILNGLIVAVSYLQINFMDSFINRDLCGDLARVDMTNATLLLAFGFLTALQIACMIIHRLGTLRHTISRGIDDYKKKLRPLVRRIKRALGSHAYSGVSPARDTRCVGVEQGLMKRQGTLWQQQRLIPVGSVENIYDKML